MGYNRRAVYLKKAAETVMKEYDGVFPETEMELVQLPGVGTYTARAILVFAFGKDVAIVDTNIRRIITHFFYDDQKQPEKTVSETAKLLMPPGKSWEWNQALMDYGAMEMGKVRIRQPAKKKPVPFRQSDRFFRGRILDQIRSGPQNEPALVSKTSKTYNKSETDLRRIIDGLVTDGLAVIKEGGVVSLP